MRMLILCGMLDRTEFTHSYCWSRIPNIRQVLVVRERKGISEGNVHYVTPPSMIAGVPSLKSIFQFLLGIFHTLVQKPTVIVGLQMNPHGYYAYLASKIGRKPLILHLVSESQGGIRGFGGGGSRFASIRKRVALNAVRHASAITVTGTETKRRLVSLGLNASKIFIAPTVVDVSTVKPMELEIKHDIITIARFNWVKRLDIFIRVVAEVNRIRKVRIAIGGSGAEETRLKSLANELGISNQVEFLGWLSEDEVIIALNQSRIFLLTSVTEGFPSTIVEALCTGICCVASNVGDMGTIIQNGVNGFLISPYDNIGAYTRTLLSLLDDDSLINRIRNEAMKTREHLSLSSRMHIYNDVLEKAIAP